MRSLIHLSSLWPLAMACAVFGLTSAAAQRTDSAAAPAGLSEWRPSLTVPGAFYMPLLGDRAKPGVYVYRFKAPNEARIPAHWHTRTMHQTVLVGTLITIMGEPLDSTRIQRFPAGSFLVTPANMRHIEWFEGETVIHIETEGPLETIFVNPADDPRRHSHP